MRTYDIAVIGAGVIGCSVARKLAGYGHTVILIDRSTPGFEASHAAAGMLGPSAEASAPSPLFDFSLLSRKLYPSLAAELIDETGIDPQYRHDGTLKLVPTFGDMDRVQSELEWQIKRGVRVGRLDLSQLKEMEPNIASEDAALAGAFLFPDDHQVDNRLLMSALVTSCRLKGVDMQLGEPVLSVLSHSGIASGVEIGPIRSPRRIAAGGVINASGAWAAQIQGEALCPLPIRPVKGHMVALITSPGTLRHVIRTEDVYLVPRYDGRVVVGSTMEEVGFDKRVEVEPVAKLLKFAQRACAALGAAEFLESWTGLRPATPDGLPIIGPIPGMDNYWSALGHFRNGILLSPITAHVLGEWIHRGKAPDELSDCVKTFSPLRFLRHEGTHGESSK